MKEKKKKRNLSFFSFIRSSFFFCLHTHFLFSRQRSLPLSLSLSFSFFSLSLSLTCRRGPQHRHEPVHRRYQRGHRRQVPELILRQDERAACFFFSS